MDTLHPHGQGTAAGHGVQHSRVTEEQKKRMLGKDLCFLDTGPTHTGFAPFSYLERRCGISSTWCFREDEGREWYMSEQRERRGRGPQGRPAAGVLLPVRWPARRFPPGSRHLYHLQGSLKPRFLGPSFGVFDSEGPRWGPDAGSQVALIPPARSPGPRTLGSLNCHQLEPLLSCVHS